MTLLPIVNGANHGVHEGLFHSFHQWHEPPAGPLSGSLSTEAEYLFKTFFLDRKVCNELERFVT